MTTQGKYIIIEGVDGSGKSTVAGILKEQLEAQGRKVETVNILKDDPVSAKVRAILTDPDSVIHPDAEAALYAAAVTNVYRHKVIPLLEQGIDVICDRSYLSTWAYQTMPQWQAGNKRPLNIFHAAYDDINPDVLILLYVTPKIGLGRCAGRDGKLDRLEQRGEDYQAQVQEAYRGCGNTVRNEVKLFEFQNDGEASELISFVRELADKI